MARQAEEIAAAREQVPGIEVLHGVEVDIMRDGSLDFDDELLAGFDIVLASLHDDAGQDGPRLLDRYLRAGPPPGERDHAPLQPDARPVRGLRLRLRPPVRRGCCDRHRAGGGRLPGTPGPRRDLARRAIDLGATLVVDSDGHRSDLALQMQFGVGTARRGWVEPRQYSTLRESQPFALRYSETQPLAQAPGPRPQAPGCRAKLELPAKPRAH